MGSDAGVTYDALGTDSQVVTTHIEQEWLVWAAENRLSGISDEQIRATLIETGHDEFAVDEMLNTLSSNPCHIVAERTLRRWKKLKSLLDIRRMLANLSHGSGWVERRSCVSQGEFLERYYSANRPVILTGLLSDTPALTYWNPDYIAQSFGDAMVQVMFGRQNDPRYEINSESHKVELSMAEYVARVQEGGTTNDYYLVANNDFFERPEAQNLFMEIPQFPEYLDHSNIHRRVFLWFGPGGTITPLHHDIMNILVAQIYGRKRFVLIPPEQTPYLYNETGVYGEVDCNNPDYERYPLYRQTTPMEVVLEPGDVLFLPVGWWHFVEALETSIMLSYINFRFPNDYEWADP